MNVVEVASIIASFVSLIVSILAIAASFYFYDKSKDTERHVQIALEAIKTQTDALQSLNAKTLDRLTKFVTTPRDETGQSTQLVAILRDLPDLVLRLQSPGNSASEAALRREVVNAYIALWNYTGTANVWAGWALPSPADFDENSPYDRLVKHITDRSAADFKHMTSIISKLSDADIQSCAYPDLYDESLNQLLGIVGDTAFHFSRRSKQETT